MKWRLKVITAAPEGTYGVNANPTAAANAMQVSNVSITPLELEVEEREYVGMGLGAKLKQIVDKKVKIEFELDLATSGTVAVAPAWGPLMRACGMAQAVNVGVDVRYTEVDENEESVTIGFQIGTNKHFVVGSRGSWSYTLGAKKAAMLKFSFEGLFVAPSSAAFPTPDFSAWRRALTVSTANTSISIHGNAHNFSELSYDHANQLVKPELVGVDEVRIDDRSSSGAVSIEAPDVGVLDYFAITLAETLGLVQAIHGTVGGQIVTLRHPQTQLLAKNYSDNSGTKMLDIDLNPVPTDAGNDATEIVLT